jgi:hypothetical protein
VITPSGGRGYTDFGTALHDAQAARWPHRSTPKRANSIVFRNVASIVDSVGENYGSETALPQSRGPSHCMLRR